MILSSKTNDPEIAAILIISPEVMVPIIPSPREAVEQIYDPSIESVTDTESNLYDASAESDITEQLLEPINDDDKFLDFIFCVSCLIQ